jgi:ABC-type branched-subunit amino acid transport system substrate-binding protein
MKDLITFKLGSIEIEGVKLNNVECTYSAEGTKEEYNEIIDKVIAATMLFIDKVNKIDNNNDKETK